MAEPSEFLIRSERIATRRGIKPGSIRVRGGRIVAIGDHNDRVAGVRLHDVGELVVLPGLVDPHVHVNDPGRSDWEGFETATRAAAAGGITTLVDMPLNSIPPTTTVAGWRRSEAPRTADVPWTWRSGAGSFLAISPRSSPSRGPECADSSVS
jgi:allantoinase